MSQRKITVIGAGLAGLYAAYSAAAHGAEVKLIEKSAIGTKHNCGELFTEVYTTAPSECKLVPGEINILLMNIGGSIIPINFGGDTPFVMTDKCKHELVMKEKCLKEGVSITEGRSAYTESVNGGEEYIIDASGVYGYKRSMGKATTVITKRENFPDFKYFNAAELKVRDDIKGYSWIFPRGKDKVNVGEGIYDYKQNVSLGSFISNEVRSNSLRGGGLLPMPTMYDYWYNLVELSGNTLDKLKVGNAAGLVNPFLGGGEHLAVLSGMLAGELAAKRKERKYVEALDEIIGDEMRLGISLYEMMRKQDLSTIKSLFESKPDKLINKMVFNDSIRKAMKKWVSPPEVTNTEVEKFVSS